MDTRPVASFARWRLHVVTLVIAMAVAVGLMIATAPRLGAQIAPGTPLPAPVGYVNDFAGVLPAESRARLEDLARRVNAATRGDMVVVTLPDLGGRPVQEVALRLGREWKLGADAQVGDAARNAGVVILVVPKETATDNRGRCRIETGQGTEGFITDAMSGAICRAAVDRFAARDYAGGIELIAAEVASRYASSFGVALDGAAPPRERELPQGGGGGGGSPIPFWVIVALFIVLPMILNSRRGRRSGCVGCIPIPIPMGGGGFDRGGFGGGFGGGGGGFGGGSFGGGGFGGFGGGGGFSGGGGGADW